MSIAGWIYIPILSELYDLHQLKKLATLPSQVEIEDVFQAIDTDKSDKIDMHEYLSFFKQFFHLEDKNGKLEYEKELKMIFRLADEKQFMKSKGDGKLNRHEFVRVYQALPQNKEQDTQSLIGEFMFNMIDKDHNKAIDKKEFKAFAEEYFDDKNDKDGKKKMKDMDTNGDGKVDFNEFMAWFKKHNK